MWSLYRADILLFRMCADYRELSSTYRVVFFVSVVSARESRLILMIVRERFSDDGVEMVTCSETVGHYSHICF